MDKSFNNGEIPEFEQIKDKIMEQLTRYLSLSALYIDCSNVTSIEKFYGKKNYGDVMRGIHQVLVQMKGNEIRRDDIIVSNARGNDELIIFLNRKREERDFCSSDLELLCERVTRYLNDKIFPITFPYLRGQPKIAVGHAVIIHNPLMREERLINRLMDDARQMAEYQKLKRLMRNKEKLQELIIKESIRTVFQPIVHLEKNEIIGYEALSRGPVGTDYENPYILFDAAVEAELVFELDRLCRTMALRNSKGLKPEHKLFINCMPSAVLDPEFKEVYLESFLKEMKLKPFNIVIEVTEREAIENYELFKEAVEYYSNFGFSIAVDDTGAGYSSLETVIELKPHFVKLDISIVRGLDKNMLKQELVKAINTLSREMGSTVIAEGIETESELRTLLEIGIPVGQGFLFAKPGTPFPQISAVTSAASPSPA
jgi:EAL domain-containing protein (putative c-di-GMP-specific phosphodiesterase class I)